MKISKIDPSMVAGIVLLFVVAVNIMEASDSARPVVIHAGCTEQVSHAVLSVLKAEIGASHKYRLALNLTDDGQMDIVLTIQMNCSEHGSVASIATVFGQARCSTKSNCHVSVDGVSLRSDLCQSNAVSDCAHSVFKAFDEYVNNPLRPRLRLD